MVKGHKRDIIEISLYSLGYLAKQKRKLSLDERQLLESAMELLYQLMGRIDAQEDFKILEQKLRNRGNSRPVNG